MLFELLRENAGKYRDKAALIQNDCHVSFGELEQFVSVYSYKLLKGGVSKGDKVALIFRKNIDMVIAMLSVLAIGAVAIPINFYLPSDELLRFMLHSVNPMAIVASPEFDSLAKELILSLNNAKYFAEVCSLTSTRDSSYVEKGGNSVSADDLAFIYLTSGTTEFPKGVMWSFGNVENHINFLAKTFSVTDNDRWMVLLPPFLSTHNSVLLPLYTGCTSVLVDDIQPRTILRLIKEKGVSILMSVATVCMMLARFQKRRGAFSSRLRLVLPGGICFPKEQVKVFENLFGRVVCNLLAMTETGIYLANPLVGRRKCESVGKPIYGVEAKIVDEFFNAVKPGEVGEIATRGANVFKGYWGLPDVTRARFVDDWFKTGDMGFQDQDGYFYYVSRKSEMINRCGYKIYPPEIEEQLLKCPGVAEAAVFGVKDAERGEIPVACVVPLLKQELSVGTVVDFLRKRIAHYKIPKIFFRDNPMPRTGSGKIIKNLIRDDYIERKA